VTLRTEFLAFLKRRTDSRIVSVWANSGSSPESGKFFTAYWLLNSSVSLLFLFPLIPDPPCPAACTSHLEVFSNEPYLVQHTPDSAPVRLVSSLTLGTLSPAHLHTSANQGCHLLYGKCPDWSLLMRASTS
jgi:hypothetical protein